MKKLFLGAAAVLLVAGSVSCYGSELKIGYVDFEKIFNEYHKTKTEDARLKADLESKRSSLDKKTQEISKLRDAAELLGEEAKLQKEKEIREKIRELGEMQKSAEESLMEERNQKWLEIYNEIRETVAKYGNEKKYTFVFDDKAIVFKADGNDLTDEIIKIMNKGK